ncbi:hypothetical protein [Rhizobium sp. G21]|uniref:hypothetical protein n=1 Tax=Rhizobium sp. G21 TaxID=2758439 RepID=UPI0016042AC5|nr:hypothetical protein [Rhizobium sp. G21]MBB1249204.1 hypothetical protein [Rhizobium sp. G21]
MADFIKENLSEKYDIIQTGEYNNIQSIVKKTTGASKFSRSDADDADKPERFNYRFWAAFSVPLSKGSRFLNMEDFTFEDSDTRPSTQHEIIDPEFIAEANIPGRDKVILENIRQWIEDRQFNREKFLARQQTVRSPAAVHGRTLLHAVVDALDKRQLSSTSLPLDVVVALLSKSA